MDKLGFFFLRLLNLLLEISEPETHLLILTVKRQALRDGVVSAASAGCGQDIIYFSRCRKHDRGRIIIINQLLLITQLYPHKFK